MAKFDRASLLLVLCVTVIISLWMPISQCSAEPVKCVADTECDACSKLAIQLYDEVEDKLAEIFSRKVMLFSGFILKFENWATRLYLLKEVFLFSYVDSRTGPY